MSSAYTPDPATVNVAALCDPITVGPPPSPTPCTFPGAHNVPLDLLHEHRGQRRAQLDDEVAHLRDTTPTNTDRT